MTAVFSGKQTIAPKWLDRAALAAASLLFLGYIIRFFSYAEDDAFIPMRYALNFWHGFGWVMNPGEHVEGCTSPLHLALVTLFLRFLTPDQTLWAEKLLGTVIGILVLVQVRRLTRLLLSSAWAGRLILLVIASQPEFAVSMINGLETGIVTLLLITGVAEFITAARRDPTDHRRNDQRKSACIFLAAALTRPELALTFPLILAGSALCGVRTRRTWLSLVCYSLPLLFCLTLRWHFYGSLVPNTYWAKHLPLEAAFPKGLNYVDNYTLLGVAWLTLPLYALGFFALIRQGGSDRLVLPTILGVHLLFLLRSGGDWMIDGRFCVLMMPLGAVVWLAAIDLFLKNIPLLRQGGQPRKCLAWKVIAGGLVISLTGALAHAACRSSARLACTQGIQSLAAALRGKTPLEEWRPGNHDGRLAVGRWIAAHARPGQTVLWSEMGLVTVVNPSLQFLDIRGLTDESIAHMNGAARDINGVQGEHDWMAQTKPLGRYLYRRRPEWVALFWDAGRHTLDGAEESNALYVPAGLFTVQCDGRPLTVATWRRRDVPEETAAACHN